MIYFDNAATTKPDPAVVDTFVKACEGFWANPHSLHRLGEKAESLLDHSRTQISEILGDSSYRTIFTSGASESNNLAIRGAAELYKKRGNHIVTTNSEHPSVEEVMRYLEQNGYEITRLPVSSEGTISCRQVAEAIRDTTILVSTIWVNNETGAINPVEEIAAFLQKKRPLYHIDAVQGIGKLPFSLKSCPADLVVFSGHKFGGLKGSGALILKENQRLTPQILGGGQEFALRSGTADVPRAASLAKAVRLATESVKTHSNRVQELQATLRAEIAAIPGVTINSPSHNSPYILNCSVEGVRPESLLHGLAKQDIYVSTLSACSSQKTAISSVIFAMTGDETRAGQTIRISLSGSTTEAECREFCTAFRTTLERMR